MNKQTIVIYNRKNEILDEYKGIVFSENYDPHIFWGDRESAIRVYPSVRRENVWFFIAEDTIEAYYKRIDALAKA